MMSGWRRQKSNNYSQEASRGRSLSKKPPLASWQPTIPSWEKKFCSLVGSVPWRKVLETKKFMHLYDNVVKWNDSAGEEAFHNAKNRFYAKIHGLPCDISLPDPDIYIDEIDWNPRIDPQLLLDLEREPLVPNADEKDENVVIFGDSLLSDQVFLSSGWGEIEENFKRATDPSSDNNDDPWGLKFDPSGPVKGNEWGDLVNNSWCGNQSNGAMGDAGRGDGSNNSWCWNQYQNNNYELENFKDGSTHDTRGTWAVNNGKRETTARYMSRSKTPRFHGNDHQKNRAWRNGKGRKRVNFVSEQPITDPRHTMKQWDMINSCGPVSHHAPGKVRQTWSWEKQVS